MATIPSGIWPIDATTTNGTELAQYLNDWVQAFSTQHANATRPPMIARGGVWAKTLGATDIALMLYDGTTDHQIGSIIGGKASFGGGTNAGTTAPASPAVGDLWFDTGASALKIYDGANWITPSAVTPITLDAVNNRVGINQPTPTVDLDVTGSAKLTGNISAVDATLSGNATISGNMQSTNITDGTDTVGTEYVVNGSAKAWVNFNGTGAVAIRKSFNMSSITDNGTGDYTANFTNTMPSADCAVSLTGEHNNLVVLGFAGYVSAKSKAAGAQVISINNNAAPFDNTHMRATVFC